MRRSTHECRHSHSSVRIVDNEARHSRHSRFLWLGTDLLICLQDIREETRTDREYGRRDRMYPSHSRSHLVLSCLTENVNQALHGHICTIRVQWYVLFEWEIQWKYHTSLTCWVYLHTTNTTTITYVQVYLVYYMLANFKEKDWEGGSTMGTKTTDLGFFGNM